jgi:hypothetical protein
MGIIFLEEKSIGYKLRTIKNASADVTIAMAIDFNSAGEKLTKQSVLFQGKKYIPIRLNTLQITDELVYNIIDSLNTIKAKTINIAGNGIYSFKGIYTQKQLDNYVYELLNKVLLSDKLITKIETVRSGGQTGIDESGAKAGVILNIPTIILAPKGWKYRDINGKDISNETLFKNRFL